MLDDWMLTLIACSLKLPYYKWRLRFVRQSSARSWWETAFQRRRIPRYFDFLGHLKSTLLLDFKQTSNQPFHATCHPLPVTRYPSSAVRHPLLATRHLLPATRYPPPATRHPSPAIRYPPPATRGKVLPPWLIYSLSEIWMATGLLITFTDSFTALFTFMHAFQTIFAKRNICADWINLKLYENLFA